MADILLTADRSLMNDFHLNWDLSQFFYGQGESLPGWYMAIAGRSSSLEIRVTIHFQSARPSGSP